MNGDKIRRNRFSHTDVTELAERVRAEKSCIPPLPEGSMRSLMKQKELECWREENRLAFESRAKREHEKWPPHNVGRPFFILLSTFVISASQVCR